LRDPAGVVTAAGSGLGPSSEEPLQSEFLWPEPGGVLFTIEGPTGHLRAILETGPRAWGIYFCSFQFAAETLVQRFRDTGYDQDLLAYPVVYLYRHVAELGLKSLLYEASLSFPSAKVDTTGHRLEGLWSQLKPLLLDSFPTETDDLLAVEEMLHQFHRVDPKSDVFRYPVNLHGEPNLPETASTFDLLHFADEMKRFTTWVSGVSGALEADRDAEADMAADIGHW
jgi:hypothetical protein